jgi:hypothetical protein
MTEPLDGERILEWIEHAKSPTNATRAYNLSVWLALRKYNCALRESDDGVFSVTYWDNNGNEFPPVRIDVSILWPKGSPSDLVFDFLNSPMGTLGSSQDE